jgi:hypothetical protein
MAQAARQGTALFGGRDGPRKRYVSPMFFRSTDLESVRASSKYHEPESLTFLSMRASSVGSLRHDPAAHRLPDSSRGVAA